MSPRSCTREPEDRHRRRSARHRPSCGSQHFGGNEVRQAIGGREGAGSSLEIRAAVTTGSAGTIDFTSGSERSGCGTSTDVQVASTRATEAMRTLVETAGCLASSFAKPRRVAENLELRRSAPSIFRSRPGPRRRLLDRSRRREGELCGNTFSTTRSLGTSTASAAAQRNSSDAASWLSIPSETAFQSASQTAFSPCPAAGRDDHRMATVPPHLDRDVPPESPLAPGEVGSFDGESCWSRSTAWRSFRCGRRSPGRRWSSPCAWSTARTGRGEQSCRWARGSSGPTCGREMATS